ncbi:hypothetical protein TWF730_005586 [Orbilia blumenaviensis]|uniref:Uncharacterized protein n=1 Tax=Orbilia blumenaviensis TaxID=1796055 RepID=A0AAV9VL30_9PEZI
MLCEASITQRPDLQQPGILKGYFSKVENTFSNKLDPQSHALRTSKTLAQSLFVSTWSRDLLDILQGYVWSYEETGTHLPYWSRGPTRRTGTQPFSEGGFNDIVQPISHRKSFQPSRS